MQASALYVWHKRKQTSAKLCSSFLTVFQWKITSHNGLNGRKYISGSVSFDVQSQSCIWMSSAIRSCTFRYHITRVFIMSSGSMYRLRSLSWRCYLSLCLTLSLLGSYRCQGAAAGSWTKLSWRTYRGRSRWEGPEESLGMRGKAYFPSTERRRVWVYTQIEGLGSGSRCTVHGQSEMAQSTQRTLPELEIHLHSFFFFPVGASGS